MLKIYKFGMLLLLLSSTTLFAMSDQEIKQIAMNAIKTVGGKLKHTLTQTVKESGMTGAAAFCSTDAKNVAKEAAKTLPKGVSVKRITDKPRNEANQATADQLKVLTQIKSEMAKGKKPGMVIKELSSNHYQVYKPIVIGKKCLNCHGTAGVRNKEAYKIIAKKYPNDKAIGYKVGELRGAFLVDIIK